MLFSTQEAIAINSNFESLKNKIFQGNCLEILPTIPDCSVNAVITDPPYSDDIRAATKRPVFDVMTLCKYAAQTVGTGPVGKYL